MLLHTPDIPKLKKATIHVFLNLKESKSVIAEVDGPLALYSDTGNNKYATWNVIHIRTGLNIVQVHQGRIMALRVLGLFLAVPPGSWDFGSFGECAAADIPESIHEARNAATKIMYPEEGVSNDKHEGSRLQSQHEAD